MALIEWIELSEHDSDSGCLVAAEGGLNVPFEIKRVYYLYDLDQSKRRGFHAHKELQQLAICVHGSCRMLLDNGTSKEEVLLDRPNRGLLIRSLVWREMYDFSENCVLMVLADEHFQESDYIRDYEEFLDAHRK